jgi:hypothetical protein
MNLNTGFWFALSCGKKFDVEFAESARRHNQYWRLRIEACGAAEEP